VSTAAEQPTASPDSPHAAVVYNPIKVDLDALRATVAAAEAEAGGGGTRRQGTSVEGTGVGITRPALRSGVQQASIKSRQ